MEKDVYVLSHNVNICVDKNMDIKTQRAIYNTKLDHLSIQNPFVLTFNRPHRVIEANRLRYDKKQNTVCLFTHLSHLCFSWVFNEIRRQIKILLHQLYFLAQGVVRDVYLSIQGNLDITRSDITKSCYNKVIL